MSLTDLTSLNETDDAPSTHALARLARSSPVKPAAVCVWARCIPAALEGLRDSGIPVCAVANFPGGAAEPATAAAECTAAVRSGAAEVDVVFPYRALLAGDVAAGLDLVKACRTACGDALLKVILETGQLATAQAIRDACDLAIEGGADFLKTSTGKTQPAATAEAAAVMFEAIAAARAGGRPVGFKASGGIRTVSDARSYVDQYEQRFGACSAVAGNFRIGASALFKDLMAVAGSSPDPRQEQ